MATYATLSRSCSALGCDRRPIDVAETKSGMVIEVCGSLVYEQGTFRQDHPKADASHRRIPVADRPSDRGRTRGRWLRVTQVSLRLN